MRFVLGMVLLLTGYTMVYVGAKNLANGGKGPTFLQAIMEDGGNVAAGIGGFIDNLQNNPAITPQANQTGQVPQTTTPQPPTILV